ncbi:MAG: alpha-amylase, partial [Bacteroidales bacterium]|nr:alpha-amylase [Bacteroidales bacterium]
MYQINPRVFAADHSFKAIAEQLDQIQELGVNVLWFMPIYEIGRKNSVNSPYCIKDYTSVNPEFGTIDDFNALVKEAHKRGLSVILDWVANHTSWDCAWLEENPEWYTRDSLGNVIHPAGTGWKDVADLDFSNQDMRNAMIEDMKYWIIEHDVDGFRCDAADYVPFDFWKQAVTELRSIPDRRLLLLAEGQRKDHFDAGFDMNYAWGYLAAMRRVFRRNASVTTLIETDLREYEGVDPGKVKLRFTTNHDEAVRRSAVDEFGGERQAMAAFVATAFLRGGMLIYDSQEVGFRGGIDFFRYVHVDWASNPEYREEYKSLVKLYNEHPAIRRGHLVTYPHDDVL